MRRGAIYGLCATVIACSSCTGLKHATPQRPLFAGFDVQWDEAPVDARKAIEEELGDLVKPAPNVKVLGMRPGAALHNAIKEPRKPNGLRNLLKNKIGSAPVYLADVPLKAINEAIVNRLNNRGYFAARSRYEVEGGDRTARVLFFVMAGTPHRLRNIAYADSTDSLSTHIARARTRSPLQQGQIYDLSTLENERLRVTATLRNAGWYHLKEDDLVFAADSSIGGHLIDVRLRMKTTANAKARQRFVLGSVYVHGDLDAYLPPNDTTVVDSLHYINYLDNFRPRTITRGVFVQPGRYYSERRNDQTVQYLMSYGVFQSVQVRYLEDSLRPGVLRTDVLLTPQKRWSLFSELNAVSKSNNFAGPGIRVGLKDRNLFRGAEVFTLDLNGRFETQIAGAAKGTNAYEIGIKAALQWPRLVPLGRLRTLRSAAPTTRAELSYGLFRRVGLYGLESFSASYGYVWRPTPRLWHDLRLLEASYNSLYYSSDDFQAFLGLNPSIRRSFEEQFMIGMGYTITYTTRKRNERGGYLLASLGVDESGNLLALANGAGGERPAEGYRIFDRRYAQYVRLRPELRYYGRTTKSGDRIALRVMAGIAKPFGNSDVVPYVKQFFVGGPNSLRAFRARSVGPGTYTPDGESGLLIDQAGDIRLEANAEYRFTIAGYLKGALFADAGNVWLINEDPQRPGGKFEWTNALAETAVGAGFGLRFDPQVIVVRLDLATPLRVPSLPQGDRWVFVDLRPRIFDNVDFNLAVGYPF